MTGLIILLIFGISAAAVCFTAYHVSRAVRSASSTIEILTDLANQDGELETTPKSVSGMTPLCIPRITRDFPEFNWYEFKQKAENMLRSALLAITKQDISLVTDASENLKNQIALTITANREAAIHETYEAITIHQTEITDYRKTSGTCIITLQTAAGFLHYQKKDGAVISGSETVLVQTRYNIELLYIQDADKVENKGTALSITCPSCGAPVTGIGQKTCAYCGCAISEINVHAWALDRYYKA